MNKCADPFASFSLSPRVTAFDESLVVLGADFAWTVAHGIGRVTLAATETPQATLELAERKTCPCAFLSQAGRCPCCYEGCPKCGDVRFDSYMLGLRPPDSLPTRCTEDNDAGK